MPRGYLLPLNDSIHQTLSRCHLSVAAGTKNYATRQSVVVGMLLFGSAALAKVAQDSVGEWLTQLHAFVLCHVAAASYVGVLAYIRSQQPTYCNTHLIHSRDPQGNKK
jgi:hypothetical protein